MNSFAFIIHPIDPKRDVARKYPVLGRYLPEHFIHFLSRFWPPVQLSHVTGARSLASGEEIEGWLIAVPYTPQRMLRLPSGEVYRKIIAAGHLAERLGAQILGLGAYTSLVGDGGYTIAEALDIPVTAGDSYTAAVSVYAALDAAQRMGFDLSRALFAVVGASGAIGSAVARLMASRVERMLLIARDRARLTRTADAVRAEGCSDVQMSVDIEAIRKADVVVTVTSSGGNLIKPAMLKSGSVVCDVSRPRDVSIQASRARDDVLVIDGGLVRVPGAVDFGFNYGVPSNLTYGCIAETMTLAFEGLFQDFSLGKQISLEQIKDIDRLAAKHGFALAALRSFEHKLDDSVIQKVRDNAQAGGKG